MSNFSVEHLEKCISEKDQYKFTQQYLKYVELQNYVVYDIVNEVLIDMVTTNKFQPTAKLFALRFLKDLIISAQFQLIDSLHESIIKQIVKVSQYDKENKYKLKRGSSYFYKVYKRNKEPDLYKVSYSYVLLATEIIYVLGNWHAEDENNEETDYVFIFKKLKNSKVPFPSNDKELKFFKFYEKEIFMKNYKEWLEKLPEIEEESNYEDKSNLHESKKPIIEKQSLPPSQNFTLYLKKSQKYQSSINLTKDNKVDNSLQSYLEKFTKENDLFKKRIQDLYKNLLKSDSYLKTSRKYNEYLKQKYSTLYTKTSYIESKCMLLETQLAESYKKRKESYSIAQKLQIESQQQKLFVTKISMERTDMEEKLSRSLKYSETQLNYARYKIGRLEREIYQIHTIKNSYKDIMDDPHKSIVQNNQFYEEKVKALEKQIEEIAEFYTKQQIYFKGQIQTLKNQNYMFEKDIEEKNSIIEKFQSYLNRKTSESNLMEKKNYEMSQLQSSSKAEEGFNHKELKEAKLFEIKKSPANFFNSYPYLKIQIYEKPSNSMSQYLFSQTTFFKKTIESKENSNDTLKSKYSEHYYSKGRNSLGKTEKSLEKRKSIPNRTSNGKTFHFSNLDLNKSNDLSQNNLQKRHFLALGRHNENSSSTALIPQKDEHIFSNKKSALRLNRKRSLEEESVSRHNGVQTLIPYIPNYFPQNQQINWFFKSLCLFSDARNKQPIFKNEVIQVKLLNDYRDKSCYLLGVTNLSYGSIKVQLVSCHEEFKIIGEKSRLIHPNSFSYYRLETKVKDLNLRYPVLSFIISGTPNNKSTNFTQNVALPLTMFEFTEMIQKIPELCNLETYKIGILNSYKFSLNPSYPSLQYCFPNLNFYSKYKQGIKTTKGRDYFWYGTLHHSFIYNVDVYMKMSQSQGQVSLYFWFRTNDKISENYSKVMIQILMFLLQ